MEQREVTVTEENSEVKNSKKKKKRKKHLGLWISTALLGVVLLIYFGMAVYFQTHFFPNTYINGVDGSYCDAQEVYAMIDRRALDYELVVEDRDGETVGVIASSDIDMTAEIEQSSVEELLQQQDELQWILMYRDSRNLEAEGTVIYDEEKVLALVEDWDAMDQKRTTMPKDAYISEYSEELGGYEIIPETEGTRLDTESVKKAVAEAVAANERSLNLGDADCYLKAKVNAQNAKLVRDLAILNKWTKTCITYDWNGTEVVLDGTVIHEWIDTEGNTPALNEEAVGEFVAANAKENDTYGKKRKFTTTLGQELTLPSGAYGWKTDRETETKELLQLIKKGTVADREPVYSVTGAHKGSDDIGNSYVECDLSNQHLYLYQDGALVLETDFVSGKMSDSSCVTPPGVFGLTYKTKNAVLRGDNYETPVSYWMPFNGNIGMHDATWRSNFGGDIFLTSGSHGCINLPLSMAKEIYGYVSTGFPVICYYY